MFGGEKGNYNESATEQLYNPLDLTRIIAQVGLIAPIFLHS